MNLVKRISFVTLKCLIIFICFLVFGLNDVKGQCPMGDVTLSTQAEVDAFTSDYPNCTELSLNLTIDGKNNDDITNLDSLSQITHIYGDLSILNTAALNDLTGLNNLTRVGIDLLIENNTSLTNLTGLNNVERIGRNLSISSNDSLINLTGLESLIFIAGILSISDNSSLTDLTAFNNLTSILGYLKIFNNASLTDLTGLEGLTTIDRIELDDNNALIDLTGLDNLTGIGLNLLIRNNMALTSLKGLESLTSISGDLIIWNNGSLTNLIGLDNLVVLNGNLNINNNDNLINLMGLSSIDSIGQDLIIYDNDNLIKLASLDNLRAIGDDLKVEHCDSLVNLVGLENLKFIGRDMSIEDNHNLSNLNGLDKLAIVDRDIEIQRNDKLSSLMGLDNLTSVEGNLIIYGGDSVSSLAGLSSLTFVGGDLRIGSRILASLTNLENLVSVLGVLDIGNNDILADLTGLDNLTSVGGLDISGNKSLISLIGLDNISSVGDVEITSNSSLNNLESLHNLTAIEGDLKISGNGSLTNLRGLHNITSIERKLEIVFNWNLPNLIDLSSVTYIGKGLQINQQDSLTNLIGLHNVTSINGYLRIGDNENLVSLTGLENIDENTITDAWIYANPNLSVCGLTNICSYLANGGSHIINGNAPDCTDDMAILNTCESLGKIQFSAFYDINQNKIQDNAEPDYNSGTFIISNALSGAFTSFPNIQNGGILYLDPGNYTISYEQDNTNWTITTDSTSYFLSLGQNQANTVHFGLYPNDLVSNMRPTVTSYPTRCNNFINFDISTRNLGTTITSGILWLEVDDDILATDFIDIPDTTAIPNRYGWFFSDVYPSYAIEKEIDLQIPGPPEFPVGDSLIFHAYTDFEDENGAQTSQIFTYIPRVRCSYDPNDKLVNPTREGDYALFDEDLIYTIRFQNTGNDVAYDVVIRDTLDSNLDLRSFRVLGSSHANRLNTSMRENGILTFEFKDIFLPDSTSNFEGSQGYVSYLIHTIDGLAEETPVTNSAGIYFDLNPPVITNTVQSIMVSELPTVSVQSPENELDFNIVPNPNSGIFHVRGITNGTYRIFNTIGQVVHAGWLNNDALVDISKAVSGIYFIEIRENEQVGTRCFVKQ